MATEAEREKARASVELLARRVARVPSELARAALPPSTELPDLRGATRWVVSGIGASEGPARLLVSQLLSQGLSARFHPVTSFLSKEPPTGDVLVVFSQRLSPNGRIPLGAEHRRRFRHVLLVTSLDPETDARAAELRGAGVRLLRHGPVDEDGLFLRVLGPALAARMSLYIACETARLRGAPEPAWAARLPELPNAVEQAWTRAGTLDPSWLFGPTAIVASGDDMDLAPALRTKLLEALGAGEPVIWDHCGLVHGPLQSFLESPRLLLVLESHAEPHGAFLRERLCRVLHPDLHRVHVLEATLPHPLGLFEHAAAMDTLVVEALRARPRDLGNWPGKGQDAPIYALDGTEPALSATPG
jgi:hypothetical protein